MTAKQIAKRITECFKGGGKAMIMGNGGSNAMAQHMVEEFICKFEKPRQPLPAYWCWAPTSIANDYGYEYVFSRHIVALGKSGDIVIVFSTSGRSKNCLMAIEAAKVLNIDVIEIPRLGSSTPKIQENQLRLMHNVCGLVEKEFI